MNDKNLKELLSQLNEVLDDTDHVDEETLALVRELDQEIHRLTEAGASSEEFDSVIDHARSAEASFAVEHPVAARFLREIIDSLSRVGI
jgi:ABC-type transporter Mla subunit MlaD